MTVYAFTVRRIASSDRDVWVAMRAALWPSANPAELAEEAKAFFDGHRHLVETAFIAEADGAAVGFVELALRSHAEGCAGSPIPYIEGWYVEPDAQRLGVGRALLAAAEEWARERGFSEIASDAQLDNTRSENAHKALGYEEVERAIHFRKML